MKKYQSKFKSKRKQNGVTLAIGIILLLIISVIGVNSMKSALLQEKMAGALMNRNYADSAAYTLLINVEHFLYTAFKDSNGVSGNICDPYCGDDPRSTEWHNFSTQKNMNAGSSTYPGPTTLAALLPHLHDEPRFVMYETTNPATDTASPGANAGNFAVTVGESDNGSAGGTSGSSGSSSTSAAVTLKTYRIATKANDKTGNYYVVYESVYATVTD